MTATTRQLFILLALMLGIGIAGNLFSELLLQIGGHSIIDLTNDQDVSVGERNWFRVALMINHFSMFLLAALTFGHIYYRGTFTWYLQLDKEPSVNIVMLWGIAILFSYPLVGFLTKINESIPLPQWSFNEGMDTFKILGLVLNMEHLTELPITLILVGLLPAIGEEFIFRGIVQQKLIENFKNPHVAILLAAILFGLTHMQLERLLPLSFLGVLLGYSFYYTRSLIVPIVLHFLNNSLQVVSLYIIGMNDLSQIKEVPDISVFQAVLSILLTLAACMYAISRSTESNEPRSQT